MGIKYFWKYWRTLNVVKDKLGSVDTKQFLEVTGDAAPKGVPGGLKGVGGKGRKGRTYVDILGCFYTEIIRCVELGRPSRSCNFAPLIQKLKRIFPDGGTVFVIAGASTSAKSETSMKRHREWGKVVNELNKVAASMKQAADDGRKRMPKSLYEKLDRLTRRSFLVNGDVKTGLAAALEAEFKVKKAPGEADVYIGRVATDLDIVVSGDSDVFCYRNVKTMVRPTRHRGQYAFDVLDKSLALRKMKLSADDLVVLAVVSGNDYESNIPGKAIVTNVKIFLKIKEKGDLSKEAMLKEYLRLCQSDRNFDVAKGVFFNFDEGKALDPLDRSKELEKRDKSLARISEARAALVVNRGNKGQEYLFKAHWTPNPFRPLQSVGEVGRYTYSTVDRTTPMKCPVPPVLKLESQGQAPSGRSSRKTTVEKDDSDEEKSAKNFTDATRAIASLSQRMIIDGQIGRVGSEHLPILEKIEALWGDEFLENLSWPDTSIKIPMLTVLMKKVAAEIDTVFSNQIVGMLPLLKERVVEMVGEEGKQATEEIEAWVDASLEDDSSSPPPPVQVFYKVNKLLPGFYRWSIVPHTSFGDGYVTMSEECLFDLLFDIPVSATPGLFKRLREVAGVGPKATKMATRAAFMKNPLKGRLLVEMFLLLPEMLAKSRYVLDDSPRRYW
ncbi:hypothetical protein SeLEV6574_g02954 [Synchytrium endobioticum]|uniref:XPG-I domain-containing protein n=1 Tax=Synchytrium endobioticum TaxID=286115 RepID=A0A507D680_9FUNG|nr:hypothetical protein SeLEV6574_g02954 [Synchytrium endobioticum]